LLITASVARMYRFCLVLSSVKSLRKKYGFCCLQMCYPVTMEQYLRMVKQQVERPTLWRFVILSIILQFASWYYLENTLLGFTELPDHTVISGMKTEDKYDCVLLFLSHVGIHHWYCHWIACVKEAMCWMKKKMGARSLVRVLAFPFKSSLTLLVGCQEGRTAYKYNLCC